MISNPFVKLIHREDLSAAALSTLAALYVCSVCRLEKIGEVVPGVRFLETRPRCTEIQ